MGVIGNFVTDPSDPELLAESHGNKALASIMIDVHTGRLTLVNSFNVLRSYFLETLLIVSVIVIVRLSLVRNVTIVEKVFEAGGQVTKALGDTGGNGE